MIHYCHKYYYCTNFELVGPYFNFFSVIPRIEKVGRLFRDEINELH